MTTTTAIAWLAFLVSQSMDSPAAGECIRLVQSSHARVRDLSFLYEGGFSTPGRAPDQREPTRFSGSFAFQRDAGWFDECMVDYVDGRRAVDRESFGLISGWRCQYLDAGNRPVTQSISPPHWASKVVRLEHAIPLVATALFGTLPDHLVPQFRRVGAERIDGRPCEVLELTHMESSSFAESCTISVDLEQAVVRRIAYAINGQVHYRLDKIQTKPFQLKDGGNYWLATGGDLSSFVDIFATYSKSNSSRKFVVRGSPWRISHFSVLPETVRINAGLDPSAAAVKFDRRFPIRETANTKLFSREPAREATTTAAELQQVIEDARIQAEDGGAPWAAKSVSTWGKVWLPLVVGLLGVGIVVACTWYVRRV